VSEREREREFHQADTILFHGPYIRLVVLGDIWYWECNDDLPDVLHWDILSPGLHEEQGGRQVRESSSTAYHV
jgi:hypothetical protein